ncbi:hypothetical protein [Streptomyces albidocamelliae]|uniref:Uncharacterized protein n=1 Tax=Streptomyces albidocamelliae TaxID=2981135 RepID=A0ABY6F1P3_9ACTN|nr:hypothetical protein [Streptomyces sp. HUAS 14-6]UXY40508.1 hypothetical protein N8I86_38760 [Streptomyces sp. HUAS 14-6]
MNGLISDLLTMGVPLKVVIPLIGVSALILLIRTGANAAATVIKAMHPGDSADAVQMHAARLTHRRWKAQRRDWNRRARAARRACMRAGLRAWYARHRKSRYDSSPITLPRLVLPPEELRPELPSAPSRDTDHRTALAS